MQTWILFFSLMSQFSFAGQIHETFFYKGAPTSDQISEWSTLQGKRGYRIDLQDPLAWDLEVFNKLQGADRIQLEITKYPGEDTVKAWTHLAEQGAELVVLVGLLPNDNDIDRLNRIGFSRYVFGLNDVPSIQETRRLAKLKAPTAITFITGSYPKYPDKEVFQAIPLATPLLFTVDYWPQYTHMDTLNLLPQHKRIQMTQDVFPTDSDVQYLRKVRDLDEITFLTTDDAAPINGWAKFGAIPVRWSCKNWVPTQKALDAFAGSAVPGGARRLSLDQDQPLETAERTRLEKSAVPVEWVHAAP